MFFLDKLINLVTGMGGPGDKGNSAQHRLIYYSYADYQEFYRSDWLARKIIDIIPFDMCREGRNWMAEVGTEITPLEELEKKIGVWQKLCIAQQWARLYGEAILYMSVRGSPAGKLNPESVSKDSLQFLHVFGPQEFKKGDIDRDPVSETFGQPTYYELTSGGSGKTSSIRIHPSRVIPFYGAKIPDNGISTQFADSVLTAVWDAITNVASSQTHVGALLPEAKTDVIYVPNLSTYLSTPEGTEKVKNRFQAAGLVKSMYNTLLLEGNGKDADGEKWEQKQINFGTFPDLLRQYIQVAAGAADIPVTRLVGQSPSGLNSTGDADIRNYYDNLKSRQNFELAPAIRTLDEVLIRSALGTRPPEIYYEFAPLWQMSEKEEADTMFVKAQATNLYNNMGLIPTEVLGHAVKNQLVEDGVYPGIEQAFADFEKGTLQALDPVAAAIEAENAKVALEMQKKALAAPVAPPKGPPKVPA